VLAEANYKVFLEKQKERDKPLTDDLSSELSMGIIDNSIRLESNNRKIEDSNTISTLHTLGSVVNKVFNLEHSSSSNTERNKTTYVVVDLESTVPLSSKGGDSSDIPPNSGTSGDDPIVVPGKKKKVTDVVPKGGTHRCKNAESEK
jgi:hypothetical protein